ncbi:MAG: glycoside hydrolase family 43 protein [Bacteroidota bacterium]
MSIHNPILKGFNPDPSIIRVGEDYYIATSTFEWFPGVQVHHSKDLANWELVTRPLNRISQLDMKGVPDSGGVWAPCLSYHESTFYLVYSNVFSFQGFWKDTPNYLVTTDDILGDWSEPIYLSSAGFDGSLFHDDDGRKWFLSMIVDHRKGKLFGGIFMQEYDPIAAKLTGPEYHIFEGSPLGCTEGPHLYKKDGYYYLLLAEGGTEYNHAVSLARSKSITGPYELHPDNPIITARWDADHPLQRTGHADLVETENGDWFMVFLASRPLSKRGRCTLGRETAIEELIWENHDWPYTKSGSKLASLELPLNVEQDNTLQHQREDFNTHQLNIHFQSLRIPIEESWCSLTERPSYLRVYGQESLSSLHRQSMIARRVQHFHVEASTKLDFSPKSYQQLAGLIGYYNTYHWHYLHIMGDTDGQRYLQILTCDKYTIKERLEQPILLPQSGEILLKLDFHRAELQFYYALEDDQWIKVGSVLDGSILSDDYVRDDENRYRPAFTGAFVGICCQDMSGLRQKADFDWFEYKELPVVF